LGGSRIDAIEVAAVANSHSGQALAIGYVSLSTSWRAAVRDLGGRSDDQDFAKGVPSLDAVRGPGCRRPVRRKVSYRLAGSA